MDFLFVRFFMELGKVENFPPNPKALFFLQVENFPPIGKLMFQAA